MLNLRQYEIVLELCENPETYITAADFADKQQVSLRTIQNDIKQIKDRLAKESCLEFQTQARKGCRIIVHDEDAFASFKDSCYQQFSSSSMYQNGRINQILQILLEQHRAISLYDIENQIYVSHSTLLNDLKQVEEILQKYDLELLRSSNKVMIDGTELNKRMCILEEHLIAAGDMDSLGAEGLNNTMTQVKNILVETFVSFAHPITEAALNNIILAVYNALRRMQSFFFITQGELVVTEDLQREREMAAAIYKRLSEVFLIRIPENEVDVLAIVLRGYGNATNSEIISPEVDQLILSALKDINKAHGIDLTDNVNLRIALGLHTAPLMVRIKYDMQLKNHLVDYIRQSFPQGFDLGVYYASHLQKKLKKRVTDDEIAFLAIHLYSAIVQKRKENGTKRILVISSMRQSENVLLRQTLLTWFSSEIAELTFIHPSKMKEDLLDSYDLFLTTEKENFYDIGLAIYISPFPTQNDYLNLKLAIDGFKSIDDIATIFRKELFSIQHTRDRVAILRSLCKSATNHFQIQEDLESAVMQREQLGSTFFGNGIAAAHPISAVCSETFVAVATLPNAVKWDADGNMVNLVLMVCIGKNNPQAFQLWNYLSSIIANRNFTQKLLVHPCYETFIHLLKEAISEHFKM